MYDRPFRWWVQSVMPLVFDDSLSYYEVLAKLTKYIEGLTGDVEQIEKILGTIEGIEDVTQFTEFLERIQTEIGNLENLQTDTKASLVSAINEVALKADIAYWKPPTGIPESDLSQEVQDKLNKSGSATEYIINNVKLKPSPSNNTPSDLGLGTYTVPDGGIPWSDLSSDVRDRITGDSGTTNYSDLNNKPQINGHTLNAGDNSSSSLGLGTYNKPESGIPESDLSTEVQEKLNTSGGIADSEVGFVATRNYVAGELLYIDGQLYRVKYDLLAGTNLIPGNNIEVTDINAELEKINSDIEALQSGSGPDSWSLVTDLTSNSTTNYVNFFEYFNVIGGENYLFICTPKSGNESPYEISVLKRDGQVEYTIGGLNPTNQQRFTFTPNFTGECYCRIRKTATTPATDSDAKVNVTLEYTQSQGISELWSKVNETIEIGEAVPAIQQLVNQQQIQLEGLNGVPERVESLESDVSNLKSAVIKTTDFNLPISSNTATYRSIKHDFVAGKKYIITAKCDNYQAPSSGGYAVIVRTTNNYVSSQGEWDSQVVDTFIIVGANAAAPGFNVSYEYTPEYNAKYLSYYTKAGNNITLDISVTEATDESLSQNELTDNIVMPRFLFKAKTNYNTTGNYVSSDRFAASELLSFSSAVHIKAENNVLFNAYYEPFSTEGASGWVQDLIIPAGKQFRLVIFDVYTSPITSNIIESVQFHVAPEAVNDFIDKYYYKITDTMRARDFECTKYGHLFVGDASLLGYSTIESSQNGVKSTKVLSSDYDVTIMVTRLYTSTCYVIIDNVVAATIPQGNSYTVPAGTEFVLSSSNGSTESSGYNITLCVSKDATHKQFCMPYTSGHNGESCDCAFIDNNGALYMISDQDAKYYCFVNGTKVVDGALLDGPVGHANTCNYADGKVYISGWLSEVNSDIYVYTVNSDAHTLTYEKTITVPVDDDEAVQHFVIDGERTILSFGMCNNYSAMRFYMSILVDGSYVKAREFKVALRDGQAGWIQGMTVKDNKLYYIMGYPSTLRHLGIGILDLGSALIEVIPPMPALTSNEVEAIIPIADKLFMLVDAAGGTYLQYID